MNTDSITYKLENKTPILIINGMDYSDQIKPLLSVPEVLALAEAEYASFYLYTCSCGFPGCAGYFAPVQHEVKGDTVHWTFPNNSPYGQEGVKVFNKDEFCKVLTELKKAILQTKKTPQQNALKKEYAAYVQQYKAEKEIKNWLDSNFPSYKNKIIVWKVNGEQKPFSTYTLHDWIETAINQSLIGIALGDSSCTQEWSLAKAKLAIKALEDYMQEKPELLMKLLKHTYKPVMKNLYSFDKMLKEFANAEDFEEFDKNTQTWITRVQTGSNPIFTVELLHV